MTSDIAWSGADCTPGVTPRQLVQSSSENDKTAHCGNCPTNHRFLINFDDTGRLDGFQEATVKLALQLRQMGRSFREYLKGLVL